MTTNDKLKNLTITHAHYLEQYKNKTVLEITKLMNGVDRDLTKRIKTYSEDIITKQRLKLMKNDVKDILGEANNTLNATMLDKAKELGTYESQWTVKSLESSIPKEIPIALIQPSPTQVLTAVKYNSFENTVMKDMYNDWSRKKTRLFTGAIQQSYVEGQTTTEIVKKLFGTKSLGYKDGLVAGSRRELATNVRTTMNHVSSVSRELTYKRNSKLIKGIQWLSTLDGATTVICADLDGKKDYYDGSINELNGQRPPAHYNCRSTTVPIVKSLKDLGLSKHGWGESTRASMNGQVSDKLNYKQWFAKQPKSFQKKTLGSGKYELYKNGMTIDKFSNNGQTLSLKQLQKLDKSTLKTNVVKEKNMASYTQYKTKYDDYFKGFTKDELKQMTINGKSQISYDVFDYVSEEIPQMYRNRGGFLKSWQGTANDLKALHFKSVASKIEDGASYIYDYNDTKLLQQAKDLKILKEETYIQLRAFNQSYMDIQNIKEVTVYRGMGGETGKVIRESLDDYRAGKINDFAFKLKDSTITGYSESIDVATGFGDIAWKIDIPSSDVILHKDLFSSLTHNYEHEKEFLIKGGERTVNIKDIFTED